MTTGSGLRVGRYTALGRIARGGMAEVFRARRDDGVLVCIKRIRPDLSDSPDFVAFFARELELASQLRHPNVVEVYDHGEDLGHYIVMELVDGVDLERLLRRNTVLDPDLVAFLACELTRALTYIHRSDPMTGRPALVHADLSPHNVLIARNGAIKLADFGIARALRRTGADTFTNDGGKLNYYAPEQWLGDKVGSYTDLWGLGLVLWRALVGTHPYAEGMPPGRVLEDWMRERVVSNERRPVAVAAPDAPAELVQAIEGLLQPVATRIASAHEVHRSVAALVPADGNGRLGELVVSLDSRATA